MISDFFVATSHCSVAPQKKLLGTYVKSNSNMLTSNEVDVAYFIKQYVTGCEKKDSVNPFSTVIIKKL